MVNDFTLQRTPRIVFGMDKLTLAPEYIAVHGENALVITGHRSFQQNGKSGHFFDALTRQHTVYFEEHISNEPSPADIDSLVEKYASYPIHVIIAIGGGSVIDTGKAVSAMMPLREPVRNYLEGIGNQKHPGVKIPFIAVPTTAGTGSETTNNAVLSETGIHGFKRSLRHDNFIPDIAVVDPALTVSCPPGQTACSGMDAFTQLLESYLSGKGNELTDALALEGIKNIKNHLRKACLDGRDIGSRIAISYAAMLSGITLTNAGLGLVHGFASSIGGLKRIPHGVICGTLMGIVNRFTVERLLKSEKSSTALEKYICLGKLLSGDEGRSDVDFAFYTANYIETLTEDLKIPSLSEYKLTSDEIELIAKSTEHKNHPITFQSEELKEMLIKKH